MNKKTQVLALLAILACAAGAFAGDAKPPKAKPNPAGTTPYAVDPKVAQVQPAPAPKKPEPGKVKFERKKGEPAHFTAVVPAKPGDKPAGRKKKSAD
jgi:hypothetical protein